MRKDTKTKTMKLLGLLWLVLILGLLYVMAKIAYFEFDLLVRSDNDNDNSNSKQSNSGSSSSVASTVANTLNNKSKNIIKNNLPPQEPSILSIKNNATKTTTTTTTTSTVSMRIPPNTSNSSDTGKSSCTATRCERTPKQKQ
mmetsp:Transcript_26974/g.56537  ORF Transcript_26974/g.56537 Transcript_26974/m.56537 type:complete len:142 (+) Transcript_26974:140-565(+)